MNINIRELNVDLLSPAKKDMYNGEVSSSKQILIGRSGSGKSTIIKSLLYEKSDIIPVGMVMSGTEDTNGFYGKFMPSTFVFNKLDDEKVKQLIMRQKIAKKHLKVPWAVLLIDDCMDDPKIFNKPLYTGLMKHSRHWGLWTIFASQYTMDLKPSLRSNIDGVFILREPSLRNRKLIYDNFCSIIPDFSTFCQILDAVTTDFTALYVHNRSMSNDWRDCVYWYKAKEIPENWKFGCKDYWKFHKQRYDADYKDPFLF